MCTSEVIAKRIVDILGERAIDGDGFNSELAIALVTTILEKSPVGESMPNDLSFV